MTSCSITVTSAPRRAAWVAAVLPAGPPPMITKRSAMGRGYRSAPAGPPTPAGSAGHYGRVDRAPQRPVPGDRCRRQPPRSAQLPRPLGAGRERARDGARRPPAAPHRAPTPRCAAARARAAPAARCAATGTPSSAARSTAPTPARPARSPAAGGRPTAPASAAGRPATTWTATSRAARAACGGSGICSGACNGTPCGCGNGRCDHRKAGCTSFRYGNCNNQHGVHRSDPVPGGHLHGAVEDRAHLLQQRRAHRQQHPVAQPPVPPGRARRSTRWPATGTATASGASASTTTATARWTLRQTANLGPVPPFTYGQQAGDLPVVGDWNGDGATAVGDLPQRASGTSSNRVGPAATIVRQPPAGASQPATARSPATGTATAPTPPGIFRKGGYWHLSDSVDEPRRRRQVVRYGLQRGDIPVVGDWDDDGVDGIGDLPRRRSGT